MAQRNTSMNKKTLLAVILTFAVLVGGFFWLNSYIYNEKQADDPSTGSGQAAADPKNAEYVIDGQRVKLVNGVAEMEAAPGSASKITTRYFGNEVRSDMNGDGREDSAFLLPHGTGGSGTFVYVVAELNTESVYIGTEAILLGDRIAPQTTELNANGNIVVNYAERAPGEPMTARPSAGKSIWLKLDPVALQFGEVEQNFEGEADPSRMTLGMKTWTWLSALYNDGREIVPKKSGAFTLTLLPNGTFSAKTDCNSVGGKYTVNGNKVTFSEMVSTKMYCEGSQEN